MADFKSLAGRLNRLGKQVEKNAEEAVKAVAREIDKQLILSTPVDTGRARSNWQVGIGTPIRKELEPYFPGHHLGLAETDNAQAAIQAGEKVINKYKIKNSSLIISNNVDYLKYLNEGSSRQAPAGFVQTSVQTGRLALRRFKILGKNKT